MFGWQGMGWVGMVWGWVFLVVLIVGVVLLVIALTRGRGGGKAERQPTGRSRAREILDERYARGELDTAEYQERLQQMGEHG